MLNDAQKRSKFKIESTEAYNRLLNLALRQIPKSFKYLLSDASTVRIRSRSSHLGVSPEVSLKEYSRSRKLVENKAINKNVVLSLIHMVMASKNNHSKKVTISSLNGVIPFLYSSDKLAGKVLRCLVNTWVSANDENVQLMSFLRIRQICLLFDSPFTEIVMKRMYLGYIRSSKFVNEAIKPRISMMQNCVVELYRLDLKSAYQCAFAYIRSLAVHLRNAVKERSSASINRICNFQFLNSLRIWTDVLVMHSEPHALRPLFFPLVQLIIGAIRLVSGYNFCPFRIHCLQLLVKLEESTRGSLYVPLSDFVVRDIQSVVLIKGKGVLGMKIPHFSTMLRSKSSISESTTYVDLILSRIIKITESHFKVHNSSSYYDDLVGGVTDALRAVAKKTKNCRWRQVLSSLITRLSAPRTNSPVEV